MEGVWRQLDLPLGGNYSCRSGDEGDRLIGWVNAGGSHAWSCSLPTEWGGPQGRRWRVASSGFGGRPRRVGGATAALVCVRSVRKLGTSNSRITA